MLSAYTSEIWISGLSCSMNSLSAKSSENAVALPEATPARNASNKSPVKDSVPTKPAIMESPAPTEFFTLPFGALAWYTPCSVMNKAPSPAMETSTCFAPESSSLRP